MPVCLVGMINNEEKQQLSVTDNSRVELRIELMNDRFFTCISIISQMNEPKALNYGPMQVGVMVVTTVIRF